MAKAPLTLLPTPCTREECPLFGEIHPKCKAHKRRPTIGPCGQPRMSGQLVCRMHGGIGDHVKEVAEKRAAREEIKKYLQTVTSYDPDDPETPEDGLLREVRWSGQVATALGLACEGLLDDTKLTHTSAGSGQRLAALLDAWAQERERHAKMCKLALDAGIAKREIDLAERQALLLVRVMMSLLQHPRLRLSAEQINEGRVVAAEVLRSASIEAPALGG